MGKTYKKPIPHKTFSDFAKEDTNTLLATIASQNNAREQKLNRIKNNVVFFFWAFLIQLFFTISLYFEFSDSLKY